MKKMDIDELCALKNLMDKLSAKETIAIIINQLIAMEIENQELKKTVAHQGIKIDLLNAGVHG